MVSEEDCGDLGPGVEYQGSHFWDVVRGGLTFEGQRLPEEVTAELTASCCADCV
jgi:hypothetical protein